MMLYFRVEKVAQLRHKLFIPDPNDPNNTIDSGRYIEELTLELIPDALRGGRGSAVVQLFNADHVGMFKPGDKVRATFEAVK